MTDLGRIWMVFVGLVAIAVGVWRARRPRTEEKLRRGFFLPSPPRPSFREPPTYEQMTQWKTVLGYFCAFCGLVVIGLAIFIPDAS